MRKSPNVNKAYFRRVKYLDSNYIIAKNLLSNDFESKFLTSGIDNNGVGKDRKIL